MTEEELKALKQIHAWIDRLQLQGQALNKQSYFDRSNDLWRVFGAVAVIHDLRTQELLDLVAADNLVQKSG